MPLWPVCYMVTESVQSSPLNISFFFKFSLIYFVNLTNLRSISLPEYFYKKAGGEWHWLLPWYCMDNFLYAYKNSALVQQQISDPSSIIICMAFHFRQKFNVPFYLLLCTIYPTFCVCHLSLHSRFNFFAFKIQLWFMQHSSFRFRHSTFISSSQVFNSSFKFSGMYIHLFACNI